MRLPSFFLWAGFFMMLATSTQAAEKPFDFASTPGKLPKNVRPTDYSVRIVPNIDKLNFTGSETVKVSVQEPIREIVLNVLDLEIASVSIDDKPLPKSAIKIDKKEELLRVALIEELLAGDHSIAITFSGKINQQGQGLYYMRYQEEGTGAKKIALGTQFEATDARRFFPCWDEPSFRARFQLTAVVPENWLAVSNMPIESEAKIDNGKEVRFAATPSMSSYLNVLCAGEFDLVETNSSGVRIRVITTKGKSEWGRYALESSAKILEYYNDYFGVPYPLPKLDQIAIPGGFGGAMENWGGITYFESVLLFDPEKSSDDTKHDIFAVLAHEMAHMWFGDLVTMAWWDNLWLNEGFASWMGTKCTAHFNPQWEVWLRKNVPRNPTRRIGISKEQAMEGDARSTTHPVQVPVATEAEANSIFDDISYQKGQSVIRMLESFLGEEPFRAGIRNYMSAHKYSNSTTVDLWNSLGESSGKPVSGIAAAWTEQPGFPVVKVRRDGGDKVSLSQERFVVNTTNPRPLEWKIPLTYFVVGAAPQSRLMTGKIDNLENIPADRAYKINVEGAGNYRIQYDPASWDLLMKSFDELKMPERVNLLSDAWALVQANRTPISLYLGAAERLRNPTELAEREQIISVFDYLNRLLIGAPEREKFQAYARSILRPSFDALGWEPKKDETANAASLRASLIEALGALADPDMIAGSRERFQVYLADPKSLPPDLRHHLLGVVGRAADDATWNKLHELGMKTTSAEEKQNYYDALACANDPKLVKKTLQIALTDELPTSRAIFLVGKVARWSGHPELVWQFAQANMKALLGKADALAINSYAPSLFLFFSDRARADELKSYAKASLPATGAKDVAKAVDEVEFRAEFKARLIPQLLSWIEHHPSTN
ncbi:MAG: M1 family metallopeptidase [Spartobacteria bacterium]